MTEQDKKERNEMENSEKKWITSSYAPGVFIGLIVFFTLIVTFFLLLSKGIETTEDAKVMGHIVDVAPRIEGQVVRVLVDNDSVVKEGDPLVLLDNSLQAANVALAQADYNSAVANFKQAIVDVKQARANFLSAQSSKELENKNLNRVLNLKKQRAITQQAVDQQVNKYDLAVATFDSAQAVLYMSENVYKAFGQNMLLQDNDEFLNYSNKMQGYSPTLDSALAKLNRAKATLDLAKLNLSYNTVLAPFSGVIANRTVEVGKNIGPNVPLLSVFSLKYVWIVANFKETQLKNLKKGESVKIKIDTYKKSYQGVVDSLAPASGDSFALLPPDNASGNFIKVTQRFPVRIHFDPFPTEIMRPGMSAYISVKAK